jgi:hypothetical protein
MGLATTSALTALHARGTCLDQAAGRSSPTSIINTMQNPHLMPPIHLHNEYDDDQISFDTTQIWSVCFTHVNPTAVCSRDVLRLGSPESCMVPAPYKQTNRITINAKSIFHI